MNGPTPKQEALAALDQALALCTGSAELTLSLIEVSIQHAYRQVGLIQELKRVRRRAKKEPAS